MEGRQRHDYNFISGKGGISPEEIGKLDHGAAWQPGLRNDNGVRPLRAREQLPQSHQVTKDWPGSTEKARRDGSIDWFSVLIFPQLNVLHFPSSPAPISVLKIPCALVRRPGEGLA